MINIGTIYKITNPSGKVYIGQTINFKSRMRYYRNLKCVGQRHLLSSLLKYGWEAHRIEVLFQGSSTWEGLNQLEIHYIRIYNSFKGGLNMTEGGAGVRGARKSKRLSEETRKKMSESRKGIPKSKEHIEKIKEAKLRRDLENSRLKKPKVLLKSWKSPVAQFTKGGSWIKDWGSIKEAGEALGIRSCNITHCLIGRQASAGGFVWRYI